MSHPGAASRPETRSSRADWPAWLALGWAVVFGCLYARMVLDERAPGVVRAIENLVGR